VKNKKKIVRASVDGNVPGCTEQVLWGGAEGERSRGGIEKIIAPRKKPLFTFFGGSTSPCRTYKRANRVEGKKAVTPKGRGGLK